MRRSITTLFAVLGIALVYAGAAGAHLPQSARELRAHRDLDPHRQLVLATRTVKVAESTLAFLRQYPRAGTPRVRARVWRNHRWLLRYGLAEQERAEGRLAQLREAARQRAIARSRPAHYAGWSCITNGATPTSPHEGNGYNGPYTGPLGMTTPWMGHYPPGSDWVHSPVTAVYAIAESVAARYGFSYSFMAGQWPQTFPPCAGFF